MSAVPSYASKPTVGAALLTTGDTSRTAPSTTGTIFTPDATNAAGGLVERINIVPVATTIASVVRIFRYDGTTYHLYAEVQTAAVTLAAGTAVTPQTLSAVDFPQLFPILVPNGWLLKATTNDTQTGIKVTAEGGSL